MESTPTLFMDLALSGIESRDYLTALTTLTFLAETRDELMVEDIMGDPQGALLTNYLVEETMGFGAEEEDFTIECLFNFVDLVAKTVLIEGRGLHGHLGQKEWEDLLLTQVEKASSPMNGIFSRSDLSRALNENHAVSSTPHRVFGPLLLALAVERTRAAELEDYTLIEGSINVLHKMQESIF